MSEDDLPEFMVLLDSTCSLLSRGQYQPSEASAILFFNRLEAFPIDAVRLAFNRHVEVSKFAPTPAEILGLLVSGDGRPGAEEAWALAIVAADERRTVVWTEEVRDAWATVADLYRSDEVGARMAFKESYTRQVDVARRALKPAVWSASEGFDPELRQLAWESAVRTGLLPALPAPILEPLLLLENGNPAEPVVRYAASEGVTVSERLAALRARMAESSARREAARVLAQEAREAAWEAAKRAANEQVRDYLGARAST